MNKELFLDILTKEEKEALLTKKMEEIRKKNDALRKRHEVCSFSKMIRLVITQMNDAGYWLTGYNVIGIIVRGELSFERC